MESVGRPAVWPPPPGGDLPEPLVSYVHAFGIGRLSSHLWSSSADARPLHLSTPRWHDLLREQVAVAAHGDDGLRAGIARHIARLQLDGDPAAPLGLRGHVDQLVIEVLTTLITELRLSTDVPEWRPDESTSSWLERWAVLNPVQTAADQLEPAGHTLWLLRLGMGEEQGVRQVVDAAGGGSLHDFARTRSVYHPDRAFALELDRDRLSSAFPDLDPTTLTQLTERALVKAHIIGALLKQDIEELGLRPAAHPCGIDVRTSETRQYVAEWAWAMTRDTGYDAAMICDWGRHAEFDWGEDEDLTFDRDDVPALRAALADPCGCKADEIASYLRYIDLRSRAERPA